MIATAKSAIRLTFFFLLVSRHVTVVTRLYSSKVTVSAAGEKGQLYRMNAAENDLRCYQLARQLHLLPQLQQVFTHNTLVYPFFHVCLDPRAKQEARLLLLCLRRWLTVGSSSLTAPEAHTTHAISHLVLSFCAFPQYVTAPAPRSRFLSSGGTVGVGGGGTPSLQTTAPTSPLGQSVSGTPQARPTAESAAAPPPLPPPLPLPSSPDSQALPRSSTTPTHTPAKEADTITPLQLEGSLLHRTPLQRPPPLSVVSPGEVVPSAEATPSGKDRGGPGSARLPGPPPPPPPDSPQRDSAMLSAIASSAASPFLTAVAERAESAEFPASDEVSLKPMFYLRPDPHEPGAGTVSTTASRASLHLSPNGTHRLYVRMLHQRELNEELLNPYFGRYGQVSCELQRRARLVDCGLSVETAQALAELHHCPHPNDLLVQDFIVLVDSHQNAVSATHRAQYKELVLVALHDPALNAFTLTDVDLMMAECTMVLRMESAAAADESKEMTHRAARQRRKREREEERRQRRQQRRRRGSRSTSSSSSDSSSSSSSGSSDSSSGSSSSSNSTTSSEENRRFVPDVVVDGFPYSTTEDQLKVLLQEHGTVVSLRLSVDDLSGAFTGAVLVRMATPEEAVRVSEALHGMVHQGGTLTSGVLNERLEMVSLLDGAEVRCPAPPEAHQPHFNVMVNEQVWV